MNANETTSKPSTDLPKGVGEGARADHDERGARTYNRNEGLGAEPLAGSRSRAPVEGLQGGAT